MPVALIINTSGSATMHIAGSTTARLESPMVVNGAVEASLEAELATVATRGVRHHLELNLRLDGGRIAGYVLAASTTARPRFGLPFYIELSRRQKFIK